MELEKQIEILPKTNITKNNAGTSWSKSWRYSAAKKTKELTNGVRTKVGTNLFDAIVAKAVKYFANEGNNGRSLRLTSEFVI